MELRVCRIRNLTLLTHQIFTDSLKNMKSTLLAKTKKISRCGRKNIYRALC